MSSTPAAPAGAARGADRLPRADPAIPVRYTGVPYAPATAADALFTRAAALAAQKQRYHAKLLSPEGEMTTLMRFVEISEDYSRIAALLLPEYLVAGVSLALTHALDPAEIETVTLDFLARLPSVEEWLRGVGIVLERLAPEISLQQLGLPATWEELVETIARLELVTQIAGTPVEACTYGTSRYGECYAEVERVGEMLEKCTYDSARYGLCYVDPAAVREAVRNALLSIFRKHAWPAGRKAELEALSAALNMAPGVARGVHDRTAMLAGMHAECMTLGYGVLDISRLCEEAPEPPGHVIAPFRNVDGEYVEPRLAQLDDAMLSCVLDVAPLGFCYLTPEEGVQRVEPVQVVPGISVLDVPGLPDAIVKRLDSFRKRVLLSPVALANYVTAGEAADPLGCERTEIWGQLVAYARAVDAIAEQIAAELKPGASAFELKQYAVAARQLLGHLAKRHRWGHAVYRMMSGDELMRYWVEYWARHGLDPEVLGALFDRIIDVVTDLAREKKELARRPRLARLGIPLDIW